MRKTGTAAMLIVVVFITFGIAEAQYYYSAGKQIPLKIDQTKVKIKFADYVTDSLRQEILKGIESVHSWLVDDYPTDGFYAYSLTLGQDFDQVASSLKNLKDIEMVEPYYLFETGETYNSGSGFVVGFNEKVSREQIDAINKQHNVVIDQISEFTPSVYVLNVTRSSDLGLLDMANIYYEMDETYFSHPNTTGGFYPTAYMLEDNYHSYQWNIKQVIGRFNQASVWDFSGLTDSLVVAVLDDGVTSHYDLEPSRILPGFDFSYPHDADPSPGPYCGHGMACTGLIAANHSVVGQAKSSPNYTGMISIDPHVKILPIKIFRSLDCTGTGVSISDLADAINYAWQHGADVLSNSWSNGFVPYDDISLAIDSAAIRGRNGKGCAVVFASGNVPGGMSWMAAHPLALGVGSCDSALQRFPYSGEGDSLDLVAPSGWTCYQGNIWSLDQEDYWGLNPDVTYLPGCSTITWDCGTVDFDCKFGGTSAATPIVSGVAALILARDPNMPRDSDTSDYSVYGVLKGSAIQATEIVPDPEYGWGRVDAFRAILSIARGDANNTGSISIADILWISNYKFQGGPAPWPDSLLGDVNCTGDVTISDINMLVDHLFVSGDPLPLPCFEFND